MPPNIHALINECKTRTEALVDEIEKYKSGKELHQIATASLESTAKVLKDVIVQITPFTELRFRRFQTIVLVTMLTNAVALAAVLVLLILKKG